MSFIGNFVKKSILDKLNPTSDLVIYVETGDRRNAGTDAHIFIRLFDDEENASEEIALDNTFTNDFERGHTDCFEVPASKVEKLNRSGPIARIEVWKEDKWVHNDWFVDKVVVENRATNSAYVFPLFRWMKNEYHYNQVNYGTSLPQDDPFKEQREMDLKEKKKSYIYDQKSPDGPVQVQEVPDDEKFSFDYKFDIGIQAVKLQTASKIIVRTHGEFSSVEDMKSIYTDTIFTTPVGADRWNNDIYFGVQRLAALNSSIIELVTAIPEKLPVTDEMLKPLLDGISIGEAIQAKRLFMCDLQLLEGCITREDFVVCSPIALFFVDDAKRLRPIAIQLFQKPGPENPIFTPLSPPETWALAKMWYNNADAQIHQSCTHLAFTHLLMEGVCICSHRNLSQNHPIMKLLQPHFLYLISINSLAVSELLAPGGWIDKVMNVGASGVTYLYTERLRTWRMDVEGNLPADLAKRGVDQLDVLPGYFFRDDVLLLFNAIDKYVKGYVALYYPDNEILKADKEIQDWAEELVKERNGADGGVGLLGVPGNGKLTDPADLCTILTSIIYTCSVVHAAVNFPQYDEYAFPINYPLTLRGTPPKDEKPRTEEDIVKAGPDMPTTLDIMTITKILSQKGTNSLGDFEVQYVYDPKAKAVIEEFRSDLDMVTEEIKRRNTQRIPIYEYLYPENIPNAISI